MSFEPLQDVGELVALHRLDQIANRAQRHGGLGVIAPRDDVDRDVTGRVVTLQTVEHRKARCRQIVGERLAGGDVTAPGQHQCKLVQEKRAEFEARTKQTDAFSKSHFPEGAQLCAKCSTAAVVMMDGCNTCLNCGDSKCG